MVARSALAAAAAGNVQVEGRRPQLVFALSHIVYIGIAGLSFLAWLVVWLRRRRKARPADVPQIGVPR